MTDSSTLAECRQGDQVTLLGVDDEQLSIQLFCMGCIPGEVVIVERIAPFGDPIIISVEDSFISLRKADASRMRIKKK